MLTSAFRHDIDSGSTCTVSGGSPCTPFSQTLLQVRGSSDETHQEMPQASLLMDAPRALEVHAPSPAPSVSFSQLQANFERLVAEQHPSKPDPREKLAPFDAEFQVDLQVEGGDEPDVEEDENWLEVMSTAGVKDVDKAPQHSKAPVQLPSCLCATPVVMPCLACHAMPCLSCHALPVMAAHLHPVHPLHAISPHPTMAAGEGYTCMRS